MMLSHFTKWEPPKFMPNISWMFRVWSTCNNTSGPILQLLKTVYQRVANTIPNNITIGKIRLNYWPVYVYEVLQANKRPNPLKNSNATPHLCLTLCKWFLQVRNWSIVRPRHFVLSTCCNVKPFTLNEIFPANVAILCREPITIKSVFRIFNVSLFELSQLKILLRSLLISVWRIDKSTVENIKFVSSANDLPILWSKQFGKSLM